MTPPAPAMLQQPTLPGSVDGIISLDPPTLQCRDCGETFTAYSERTGRYSRIAMTVILSGCEGWGFTRCGHDKIRRCGDCNAAHRAEHGEAVPA